MTLSSCNPTDADGNPPVGDVDDSAGFYVRHMASSDYTYVTHKGASTFDEDCVAEDGEDITCYIEAEELDLYNWGVRIQYNVPSTFCDYVGFSSYYYYARATGTGPTTVQVDTDSTGAIGVDSNSDGTIDGAATTTCQYDYTASSEPNCCEGTYSRIDRSWNSTDGAYDPPVTTTDLEWGGDETNCIVGPAVDTHPKSHDGFPTYFLYFVAGSGLNALYEVASPISKRWTNNLYVANFFDAADHGGGNPTAAGDPYYRWTCYDRAQEVKARITLMVREWNTEDAFDDRANTPTGYDAAGNETTPVAGVPYNDWDDWKDTGNSYPGFY